jgi:hypothetical protein
MRPLLLALPALLLLAGCGGGGRGELDIVEIAPSASGTPTYDVDVRAGQLRALLGRGPVDLQLVECAAPDRGGESVPITFGGEKLESLSASQVSDDPDMQVRLTAEIPRDLAARPGRCARLVGRSGLEIASRPVPLPQP